MRILLFSERYLAENPFRERALANALRKKGFFVTVAYPTKKLSKMGYEETFELKENECFCSSKAAFLWLLVRHKIVLLGLWKEYAPLAYWAKKLQKVVIGLETVSGMDLWQFDGIDAYLVKGPYSAQYLCERAKKPITSPIIPCGALAHEGWKDRIDSKQVFFQRYTLDSKRPLAILFPKGIYSLADKIPSWFPHYSQVQCAAYNEAFLNCYKTIARQLFKASWQLCVKMHPSAFANFRTHKSKEIVWWEKELPELALIHPEDTYNALFYADVGLGINTHSALDTLYFKKPFIYVDCDRFERPKAIPEMSQPKGLPKGKNPWFSSWYGTQCHSEDLATLLHNYQPEGDPHDYLKAYWTHDGSALDAITQALQMLLHREKTPLSV